MAKEAAVTAETKKGEPGQRERLFALLRRRVTPKVGAALAIWRVEARLATPLALLLVATLGRWNGALAMGGISAVYSAAFLFLLDGEQMMADLRSWMRERRWMRRYVLPIAEREDGAGTAQRFVALPATVMFMGPFWRAVTYHLFRLPRPPAYALSVGGSIPHSLFWTGLVLGGLWEVAIRPLLERVV